jgi:hypothetical protein
MRNRAPQSTSTWDCAARILFAAHQDIAGALEQDAVAGATCPAGLVQAELSGAGSNQTGGGHRTALHHAGRERGGASQGQGNRGGSA